MSHLLAYLRPSRFLTRSQRSFRGQNYSATPPRRYRSIKAQLTTDSVLRSVVNGEIPPGHEYQQLITKGPSTAVTSSSVIRGSGYSSTELVQQISVLLPLHYNVLITGVESHVFLGVQESLQTGAVLVYNNQAQTVTVRYEQPSAAKPKRLPGSIGIISGPSDLEQAVANECKAVAEHLGCYSFQLRNFRLHDNDKISSNLEAMNAASVIIVISQQGELVSLLSGLVEAPLIAVPIQGSHNDNWINLTNWLGSLPISIVNANDGCAASFVAMRILKQAGKLFDSFSAAATAVASTPAAVSDVTDDAPEQALYPAPEPAFYSRVSPRSSKSLYGSQVGGSSTPDGPQRQAPLKEQPQGANYSHILEDELHRVETELILMNALSNGYNDDEGGVGAGSGRGELIEAEVMILGPRCPWPAKRLKVVMQ